MVSFRFSFPFSVSHPPSPRPRSPPICNASSRSFSFSGVALSAVTTAAVGAGIAVSQSSDKSIFRDALNFFVSNTNGLAPLWGSLSLSLSEGFPPMTESRTGISFPAVIGESQRLLGVGLRRKAILGLKNIDVYAFGVYAEDENVKKLLSEKYGVLSASELKGKKQLMDDLMDGDVCMTVRLQIAYGRLSIRSVRSAFEESVGSRLQKFGGSDNKELLQRFTSQFKDEYKIPRGSIIDLSRERGYVLRTIIDGKEVGSIQSKLLCRAILDLYIGNTPFDQKAKEDVKRSLANLIGK